MAKAKRKPIVFVDKEEVFEYLDWLRTSGVTNMFGAGSYLQDAFAISPTLARKFLLEWMATFEARQKAEQNNIDSSLDGCIGAK